MKKGYLLIIAIVFINLFICANANALTVGKINSLGGAVLRTGPGTNYKADISLKYNDPITVISSKATKGTTGCANGWMKVSYNNYNRYICSNEITGASSMVKTNGSVNIRNGAGTNYAVHRTVGNDTLLILSSTTPINKSSTCSKGWYKIILDKSWGKYVCANNVKKITNNNVVTVTGTMGSNLRTSTAKNGKKDVLIKFGASLILDSTIKHKGYNCSSGYYKVFYKGRKLFLCSNKAVISNLSGVATSSTGLNIRKNASNSSRKISSVGYFGKISLLSYTKYKGAGCSGGYYKVNVAGQTAYACSNYISISSINHELNANTAFKQSYNSNSKTLAIIPKGKYVSVIADTKYNGTGCGAGWLKITYNGTTGYVCSSQTDANITNVTNTNTTATSTASKKISTTSSYNTISKWTYRVNEDYAYVRSAPTGSIRNTLYLGTELDYLGTSGATSICPAGWYKVKYFTNKTGYICKTYVDKYESVTKTDTSYCNTLKAKGFPASYCPYLSYIHSKHSNWIFQPENTKVTLANAINGESKKNYTQITLSPYLYSTSIAEAPNWRIASNQYVGFMLDPRSYLNEKNIFAFENLGYDSSNHTKTVIRSIVSGTYLDNDTYANYFLTAGKNNKVSPVHLAARVKQEGGTNSSYAAVSGNVTTTWRAINTAYVCASDVNKNGNTIQIKSGLSPAPKSTTNNGAKYSYKFANGTEIKATSNDKLTLLSTNLSKGQNGCSAGWYKVSLDKSLKGIYNYYNIGAYGSNPVIRGLAAAAGYVDNLSGTPWNTREKAISNGAKFIAQGYISKGQDTMYYQKFNTGPNNYYNKYTHQYMTNILAPASESLSTYTSYSKLGILNKAYSFKIPVYNSMPNDLTSHPIVK